MAKKTRYSDEFRTNAVLLVEAAGYPKKEGALATTAKRLGVPQSTLRGWWSGKRNPPPTEMRAEKKGELADLLRAEIRNALGAMDEARPEASYRDLATSIGIMTDKLQLLTGEPTDNNRTRIVIEYADTDADATPSA